MLLLDTDVLREVFVNHPTMVEADLPFGGIRHFGYGRELLGLGSS